MFDARCSHRCLWLFSLTGPYATGQPIDLFDARCSRRCLWLFSPTGPYATGQPIDLFDARCSVRQDIQSMPARTDHVKQHGAERRVAAGAGFEKKGAVKSIKEPKTSGKLLIL